MNGLPFPGIVLVYLLVWLGVIVFVLAMVWRLVRGVERIAAALERQ